MHPSHESIAANNRTAFGRALRQFVVQAILAPALVCLTIWNANSTAAPTANSPSSNPAIIVTLDNPQPDSVFSAPASITLGASVAPANSIVKVEFFNGNNLLGSTTLKPYTLTLNKLPVGFYNLTAKATDMLGKTWVSSNVSIEVAQRPSWPIVTLTAVHPSASEDGAKPGIFRVSRTGDVNTTVKVAYRISGTAQNGSDYQRIPSTVTIPTGAPYMDIKVVPIADNDSDTEEHDDVVLQLVRAPANWDQYAIGSPGRATVTIAELPLVPNGSPVVTITTVEANATEVNAKAGVVRVMRTGETNSDLLVAISLGGDAVNGADYRFVPSLVNIPAGSSYADIKVVPNLDNDMESEEHDEVIFQILPSPNETTSYRIGSPNAARVTITEAPRISNDPQVTLLMPQEGTSLAVPARILLLAHTSTPGTTAKKVEFFLGSTSLGFGTPVPFEEGQSIPSTTHADHENPNPNLMYYKILATVPEGDYVYSAKVTDGDGATASSPPVHVTVNVSHPVANHRTKTE
jgi:hypothetical protein